MRRSTLVMCALLPVATSGCEQVQRLVDRVRGRSTRAPTQLADTARRDTAATPVAGGAEPADQPPPRERATPQFPASSRPFADEPFFSDDTGTVAPGMTEREVYALWGEPAAVRRSGEFTYLFFRNGCEYTCGTMDLVTLQNGQVVDAVVRWPGHVYSGRSSSPPDNVPGPTRVGDTLRIQPAPAPPPPSPASPTTRET